MNFRGDLNSHPVAALAAAAAGSQLAHPRLPTPLLLEFGELSALMHF